MDLRQLRYFVAVAEAGGIRAASRSLFVAQPSISQALRSLEAELGAELLERLPHGVRLTDAGQELLRHARGILLDTQRAELAVRMHARRPTDAMRIGVVAGALGASHLTAPIFGGVGGSGIQLHDLAFGDQITPLLSGHVDVAVVRGPIAHADLEIVPIALEPRALLVGADHELAGADRVGVDRVLDEHTLPLVAPDAFAAFWQLDDVRGRPNVRGGTRPARSIQDIQLTVASGEAVICVPSAFASLAPHPLLRSVVLDGTEPSVIAVASRRADSQPRVAAFVDHAVRMARQHIALLPGGALPS